jgi:hypothetical protein
MADLRMQEAIQRLGCFFTLRAAATSDSLVLATLAAGICAIQLSVFNAK